MFVHSVLIVKPNDQHILYSRHFGADASSSDKANEWQEAVYNATADTWPNVKPEEHFIAIVDNKFIVYTLVGEVLIFVAGQEQADELGLAEVLHAIVNVLNELGRKKGKLVTEEGILAQYAKVCSSLNAIIQPNGAVNLLDVEEIRGTTNMKPEETRAKKLQREQKEQKKLPKPQPPPFNLLECFSSQPSAKPSQSSD